MSFVIRVKKEVLRLYSGDGGSVVFDVGVGKVLLKR